MHGASLQLAWSRRCSRPRARGPQPEWRALMLGRALPQEAVAVVSQPKPNTGRGACVGAALLLFGVERVNCL